MHEFFRFITDSGRNYDIKAEALGIEESVLRAKKTMNILPVKPVHKTHERLRRKREAEQQRLIGEIGIRSEDAPLLKIYPES